MNMNITTKKKFPVPQTKNRMKRLLSLALALILVVGVFQVSFAAPANYAAVGYTTSLTDIYEGQTFTLNIDLLRYANVAQGVSLVNTSEDAFTLSTNKIILPLTQFTGNIAANEEKTVSLSLKYLGKGKTFTFNIISNADGSVLASESIAISQLRETSTAPVTPTDTSKYIPKLSLAGNSVLGDFTAGKSYDITVGLKNTASYGTKNITAVLEKGEDTLPVSVKNSTLNTTLSEISNGKSGDIKFKVAINAASAPKTYAVQVKLSFENAFGDKFSEVIPVYLNVENNALEPMIGLVKSTVEGGPVDTSEAKDVVLTFKNGGTLRAQKITVQLTGFKADGVRLNQDIDTKLVGAMGPEMTGSVRYSIIASPLAKGTVELEALVKYYDDLGAAYERKVPVYITVANVGPTIKGVELSFDKNTYNLAANKSQKFTVTVKNTSAELKKDLKLTITSDATLKFLTPYVQMIDELKGNSSKTFTFETMLSGTVAANTYPLYATLVPQGGAEGDQRVQVSGIYVGGEGEGTSKPKIIIETYEYGGDSVMAGSTFDLLVKFTNTSGGMGIRNAKVVMTADEGIFILVDAANSFFIDKIGPNDSFEQLITLKAKADAKVQMYGIAFKIEYEDQNGKSYDEKNNPYVAEERISLPVKQEIRLEVSDIVMPPEAYVGTPIPIETEFFNMGKSPMYNLMVKLEGNFQSQNSNYFVGNFEAGRSDFFSGSIIPDAPGELKGDLVFVYEDETGVKQEVRHALTTVVMEGASPGGDGTEIPVIPGGDTGVVDPAKPPIDLPLWAWAAIVVIPLALGTFIVLRIRKKKRLKALLEVADED